MCYIIAIIPKLEVIKCVLFSVTEVVHLWWSNAVDGPISSVRILHHTPSKPPPPLTHSISHEIGIISTGSTGTGSYHMVVGSSLELGVIFLYVCHNKIACLYITCVFISVFITHNKQIIGWMYIIHVSLFSVMYLFGV